MKSVFSRVSEYPGFQQYPVFTGLKKNWWNQCWEAVSPGFGAILHTGRVHVRYRVVIELVVPQDIVFSIIVNLGRWWGCLRLFGTLFGADQCSHDLRNFGLQMRHVMEIEKYCITWNNVLQLNHTEPAKTYSIAPFQMTVARLTLRLEFHVKTMAVPSSPWIFHDENLAENQSHPPAERSWPKGRPHCPGNRCEAAALWSHHPSRERPKCTANQTWQQPLQPCFVGTCFQLEDVGTCWNSNGRCRLPQPGRLLWNHGFTPKDAAHVAGATRKRGLGGCLCSVGRANQQKSGST